MSISGLPLAASPDSQAADRAARCRVQSLADRLLLMLVLLMTINARKPAAASKRHSRCKAVPARSFNLE